MNRSFRRYLQVPSPSNICMIILFLLGSTIQAQEKCAFDILHQRLMKDNPAYKKQVEAQEIWIGNYVKQHKGIQTDRPNTVQYTIPVVVHIVHTGGAIGTIYNPTDAAIQNTINYLNQVYNGTYPGTEGVGDIEIQFALAVRDTLCNPTTGIERIDGSGIPNYTSFGVNVSNSTGATDLEVKNTSRWDPSRYYNIWVVNMIDSKDGTSGSFVAGYAYFPNAPANLDGTIMLATQMAPGKKTLPHEIGHAFSLYHPFEGYSGSTCPVNADCTTDGDKVCDTDPIVIPAGFVCRSGINACTSTPYDINTEHNYMNYTSCATLFTAGQKARLLASAGSASRIALSASYALSPVYPMSPYVAPIAASCTPVTSAAGLAGDFAGIVKYSLASKSTFSGTSRNDAGYLNNTSKCHTLVQLQRGSTYTIDVTLVGANAEQLKGWIDFDNNGIFNNATEQVISFSESSAPAPARGNITVSAAFTVPVTATLNTTLRLRLLEDLSTIYGVPVLNTACINPTYGQAEDYPIYLLPSGALPLNLLNFSGMPESGGILLTWETSMEVNTDRFIIQRSVDGASFSDIGEVPAKGMQNQVAHYNFRDGKTGSGARYYRLNMIDRDGKSEYSKTISITIPEKNQSASRILTNPITSALDIQLGKTNSETFLSVFDITGKRMLERKVPAGTQRYRINETMSLQKGVYILEIRNNNNREILRFIRE